VTVPSPATLPDPEKLPPTFPVQVASKIRSIGRNRTYDLIKAGTYPVRVRQDGGRHRVTRVDLLRHLGYEIRAAS
jgi:hypothetical protein